MYEGPLKQFLRFLALHYTIPFNRFVAHFTSHLIYTALILLVAINPADVPGQIEPDWYDYLAIIYSVAYLIADAQENAKNMKMGFTDIIITYNFVFRLLILVGMLLKAIGFYWTCLKPEDREDQQLTSYMSCTTDDPSNFNHFKNISLVSVGYGLYSIGMTLSMLKILYWSQLHHILGPLSISIKKVIKDLILVATAYALFLIAFSVSITYILELSKLEFCDTDEVNRTLIHHNEKEYHSETVLNQTVLIVEYSYSQDKTFNHFRNYTDALKTAFWSLFEPGHPEVVGCSTGRGRRMLNM